MSENGTVKLVANVHCVDTVLDPGNTEMKEARALAFKELIVYNINGLENVIGRILIKSR